jgi:signal transduction histidine kinase/Na+/proline symporter
MFDLTTIIICILTYAFLLFLLARWVEAQRPGVASWTQGALVYGLAQAVLCSTHTYYGHVGSVPRTGMYPLIFPVASSLALLFGWNLLSKLVSIKERFNITSIADFLSARYGKSQLLGALATIALSIGLLPIIAIQFRAMVQTTGLITRKLDPFSMLNIQGVGTVTEILMVGLMILFTLAFGLRTVTPGERNPGLMAIIALQSLVKLFAFLAAGIFITYGLFGGFEDIFSKFTLENFPTPKYPAEEPEAALSWYGQMIFNCLSPYFLPRQFHVAVIQNQKQSHIKTAVWLLPLYLITMGLFVVPIGFGGMLLGKSLQLSDYFPLILPIDLGPSWLALLVYMGGISAAMSMIIVESTAIAIMFSNHIFLPLADTFPMLRIVRRYVRGSRWFAATLLIISGFLFHQANFRMEGAGLVPIGTRTAMGLIQFVPAIFGGLYWKRANRAGALLGLTSGMIFWIYNLFSMGAPAPWPAPDSSAIAAIVGLVINILIFIMSSLIYHPSFEEERVAAQMVDILRRPPDGIHPVEKPASIERKTKQQSVNRLFEQYYESVEANRMTQMCFDIAGISKNAKMTLLQLGELEAQVESALASSIGTASAHGAVKRSNIVTEAEAGALTAEYQQLVADMKVPRPKLYDQIISLQEHEKLLSGQAHAFQFLANAAKTLASTLDLQPTIRNIAEIPLYQIAQRSFVCVLPVNTPEIVKPFYQFDLGDADSAKQELIRQRLRKQPPDLATLPHVSKAMREMQSEITFKDSNESWNSYLFSDIKIRASITVPLIFGNKLMGTLSLLSTESRFTQPLFDIALIEQFAQLCATVLENAFLYQAAQEAIQAREDFMEAASHELKTPLTPLKGQLQLFTHLLKTGQISSLPHERLIRLLQIADSQLNRFVNLVNQLLDVSAITSGQFELYPEKFDVGELFEKLINDYYELIKQSECKINLAKKASTTVYWDKHRIEHVILNLLSNALKFAPNTEISITVTGNSENVEFSVHDRGAGIAKEDQNRIFQRFERLPSARNKGGFGLGLYISNQIVLAHGGTMRVQSTPGSGSTFTVKIPKEIGQQLKKSA